MDRVLWQSSGRAQLGHDLLMLGMLHQKICSSIVLPVVVLLLLRKVVLRAHFTLYGKNSGFASASPDS